MLSNGAQFEFGAVCVYGCCACRRCTRVAAEERERGCLLRLLQQGQSIRISAGQIAVDILNRCNGHEYLPCSTILAVGSICALDRA